MEEAQVEDTKKTHEGGDSNLPAIVASLEMLTVNGKLSKSPEKKRVLRKRIPKVIASEILNRRCSIRPKKRKCSDMESEENVKEYYLDKNIKKVPNNLETIYEEKDNSTEDCIYMSVKRYKRMIQFQQQPTDSKLKKRRAKIQKVFGSRISFRKTRGSMQMLLDKLNRMRPDAPGKTDIEVK